jgi:hypothetical protein
MLELLEAAPRSGKVPAVVAEEPQNVPNLHDRKNLRDKVALGQPEGHQRIGAVGMLACQSATSVALLPNGWRSAAVDITRSRRGHERSECLGAYHSSTGSSNAR